jgi:hypothetical protein
LQPSLSRQQQSRTDGRMAGQAISDGRTGHHLVLDVLDIGQGIIVDFKFIQDVHGILVNEVDLGVNTRMERPCPLTESHACSTCKQNCVRAMLSHLKKSNVQIYNLNVKDPNNNNAAT